ncbi:MAG: hypothetical protein NVSMB9_22390 [Isosphaeraceae bacterium]
MKPKSWTLALAATAVVAGCTLNKPELRRDTLAGAEALLGRLGGGGQVIEPKRCGLKVVILPRPLRDRAVHEGVWASADEQVIAPEVRRALQANGLRVGIITGGLPTEVESALAAPPPNKVDPAEFNLPEGANTLVSLTETRPQASILLNRDSRAFGKDYKEVTGWFRVTVSQDGPTGVTLRLVPELHHGPVLRRYDSLPNNNAALNTMQFMQKDGQQEETLRDLAASLTLQPGQVAVIGCDPDRRGGLGSFLFTQPEANSDRLLQKIVLVWATRTNVGEPGSQAESRPKLEPIKPSDSSNLARKDVGAQSKAKPRTKARP